MMIAIATAASAAAIVMMKMVKKMPSSLSGYKYLLNATKLMFTLFSISSIDISIVIRFLRVNNPYMPIKNRAVLTNKIWLVVYRSFSSPMIYGTFDSIVLIDDSISDFFDLSSLQVLTFIAITIQPIIAASNNILTTSNGNA